MYKPGDFIMYFLEESGKLSSREVFYIGMVMEADPVTEMLKVQSRNRDTNSKEVMMEKVIHQKQVTSIIFYSEK